MATVTIGNLCLIGGKQVEVPILGAACPAWLPDGHGMSIGERVWDRLAARSQRWREAAQPAARRNVAREHGNGKHIGRDTLRAQPKTRQLVVPACVRR